MNCREAADGFCDTAADYLFDRWPCNNNAQSRQTSNRPPQEQPSTLMGR
ncbi:MAG: hypothetical protein HC912_03555 [Saprospiraceae bacterium]|nr:hypothetical protein [Saprospiraceae bacterium]